MNIRTPLVQLGLCGLCLLLAPQMVRAGSLESHLMPLIESHRGEVAVAVKHLETGESYRYRADIPMPTASLIKFPVMIEAYRQDAEGKIDLNELVTLNDEEKVPGSGILTTHFSEGATIPLRDMIRLMIAYSDNTATNYVLDAIGLDATAKTMEAMGFPNSKIHSKVFRRDTSIFPERSEEFGLGSTTADDIVALLAMLHERKIVDEATSDAMFEHLLNCQDDKLFKRYLPAGTKVAHKTGAVTDARTSGGIIETPGGPVALCVLTTKNEDRRWAADNAGERFIARVAQEVYNHFNQLPSTQELLEGGEPIKIGAMGPEIEGFQRALNAQLKPSPNLTVDGDFGPLTQAALVRFQRENDLPESGTFDSATRTALGPPPDGSKETEPSTEVINAEVLSKRPLDPLDGPPQVTAKAWAILDATTGNLVAGSDQEAPLAMASTTKIMTAYLVLTLAEEDPEILDEVVTFSSRADQTVGSTAGVRSGERVPVGELLYGLLLPSGNDASVALAEHFGARLGAPEDQPDELDPLDRFVAAMNRTAAELGLKSTHFTNPHGLTHPDHHASAFDLTRLALEALKLKTFATIVSTRQHASTLIDQDNKTRVAIWRNTNRLLPIEGFDGVKTGTTSAAGACLVSTGTYNGNRFIIAVLGSQSSDARYVDSRNLYQWVWNRSVSSSRDEPAGVGAESDR